MSQIPFAGDAAFEVPFGTPPADLVSHQEIAQLVAPAPQDDYPTPYRSDPPDSVNDPWGGFPNRECTSFVAWRMHRDGYGLGGITGDAGTWDASATGHGIVVDHIPRVGAIAQWHGNEVGGAAARGHVAYVRQANPDESIWVEDYNWTPERYLLHLCLRPGAPRYIYVEPAGAVVVDDQSLGFARFGPSNFFYVGYGGFKSRFLWTYTNGNTVSNWVQWSVTLPQPGGNWIAKAFVPSTHATTQRARYEITHADPGQPGQLVTDVHQVDQSRYFNEWVSLGTYEFTGSARVRMKDDTSEVGRQIGFDAVMFIRP